MEDDIKQLQEKVEQLEAIIASLATIALLEATDDSHIKINEILSKFNIK